MTDEFTASMVKEMMHVSNDPIRIFYNNGLILELWENKDFIGNGNSIFYLCIGPLDISFDELVVVGDKLLELKVGSETIGNICLNDVKTVYEQSGNKSIKENVNL